MASQYSVKKYFTQALKSSLASHSHSQANQEGNVNNSEVPLHSSQEFDLDSLKFDPGERIPILNYHPNNRDVIGRAYLMNGPCQPRLEVHKYPQTNISGLMRRFNLEWFNDVYHDWFEYSASETKKHLNYPLVFRLVKLALLLPVVTASVERAISAMKFIKNDLRSQISDDFSSDCLVPYLEKDVFDGISNDAIIKTFQDMKPRRVQL